MLPGGRISGQKAQKGPGKKMVGRKNFMSEFCQKWPKRGQNFFFIFFIAEMRQMTHDRKKFAQHLDFCRKLLDKNYLLGSCSKQAANTNTVRYLHTVLPGGRIFGQKAQKGPEKKMVGRKNFIAEFWPTFVKSGRKGAANFFW